MAANFTILIKSHSESDKNVAYFVLFPSVENSKLYATVITFYRTKCCCARSSAMVMFESMAASRRG